MILTTRGLLSLYWQDGIARHWKPCLNALSLPALTPCSIRSLCSDWATSTFWPLASICSRLWLRRSTRAASRWGWKQSCHFGSTRTGGFYVQPAWWNTHEQPFANPILRLSLRPSLAVVSTGTSPRNTSSPNTLFLPIVPMKPTRKHEWLPSPERRCWIDSLIILHAQIHSFDSLIHSCIHSPKDKQAWLIGGMIEWWRQREMPSNTARYHTHIEYKYT